MSVELVESTASTQDDLVASARAGAPSGTIVLAREQTGGRGRLARKWSSPKDAGLWFSALLRSPSGLSLGEGRALSLLPLFTGVALARTMQRHCQVSAALKWPNDVLIENRKVAGLLVTSVPPDGFVIGIGVNTLMSADQLPVESATSLLAAGVPATVLAPEALLSACLLQLAEVWSDFVSDGGDGTEHLLREYIQYCSTIGRNVVVHLPDGTVLHGLARAISTSGALIVAAEHGEVEVMAGDVVTVR